MKTFFTADLHFEHDSLVIGGGFADATEYNAHILDQINRTVGEKDRLFVLGDFCWRAADSWFHAIRCRNKHLLFGNHDKPRLGKLFNTAEDVSMVKLQGRKIFLSHYPHAYWPSSHHGSLHLYGHCHAQREQTLDAAFPGRRSMDCSIWNSHRLLGEYRPFNEDEIISRLTTQPGHDPVEFYDKGRPSL